MECLKNIIGVTADNCECYGIGADADLQKSMSGLFIDQLEGGITLKAVTQTDSCKTLLDMMKEIRDLAIKRTGDDVKIQIADKYSKAAKPYLGDIGENTFTGSLPVANYFGQKWTSNGFVDAVAIIKKISYLGTAPVEGDVADNNFILYKQVGGTKVIPISVFSTKLHDGNKSNVTFGTGITELRLPMTENGHTITYFWAVQGTGFLPRNNKARCNCGNKLIQLDRFMDIKGYIGNTASALNIYTDEYAHGLIFDVELRCDDNQLICREYDENNAVSVTLAYAAQFKAGELLIESVLRSPEVNRFTMMNREYLWGKRNHFKTEYENRIKYIRKVVDVSESGCFICRNTDIIMGNIYS